MKKYFFLILIGLLTRNSYSQENTRQVVPKNVIQLSLGSFVLVNSAHLSYDRLIATKEKGFFKSYYFTAKSGGNFTLDFSGSNSGTGLLTAIGVTGLTGKGKSHFEVGLGLGYFLDHRRNDDNLEEGITPGDDSTFYPSISIGYRKQSPKGFVFRTGLGAAEWFYIGFGYSF
ncbi:hypothetical protein ACFSQJ_00760 [Croceitalea marina]|uniref:DUF3575 domain-containing protein n=1 Tax=Croceitalea marina TaxID=1775166 RepID=A0ABW5MQ10_9FLAO